MTIAEHTRIARYFAPLAAAEPGAFALVDDAALLTPPDGKRLVVTTDSVIAGTHVLLDAAPQHIAQKLVRRNLSDLAAMGATPWRYTLNLHTPRGQAEDWFDDFTATLAVEQEQFGMVLAGGDSTSGNGPIHATMTCIGLMARAPLTRQGAQANDDLYASGTLGDAAMGLKLLQRNIALSSDTATQQSFLIDRYHCPTPRLTLGESLCGIATSAMDISDGLLADLAKLSAASGIGATVEAAALPLSPALCMLAGDAARDDALSGGDDYELLFTAPPTARDAIANLARTLSLPLTRIGSMGGSTVRVVAANGAEIATLKQGWSHD